MEQLSKKLMDLGVDVDGVVRRLGGNEALYLAICCKFIRDPNYMTLQEALLKEDYQSAEAIVHTLKGVAANLGFIKLENLSKILLQDLKENRLTALHGDNCRLTKEYKQIIDVLTANRQV